MAGTRHRGFAAMDREKQRAIASKGGKAAHAKGVAHEFTSEEARAAGRKGGRAGSRRRHAPDTAPAGEQTSRTPGPVEPMMTEPVAPQSEGTARLPAGAGDMEMGEGADEEEPSRIPESRSPPSPSTRPRRPHPFGRESELLRRELENVRGV